MMPILLIQQLNQYRARTYFTAPGMRLTSSEDAVNFVNQRGFVSFWPIKGLELPSLWAAAAGDRPVPDAHDDPGHVTWGWKDESLGKKRWYYGRVIKRRNAMISLEALPFFYALSPNFGEPEQDYLIQYEQGQLRPEAKWVFEALLQQGPLDTLALRKAAHLSSTGSDSRFTRAVDDLMMEFKILPIGIAPVGAWKYAFIYDCTHRHLPDLFGQVVQAGLDEPEARRKIVELYLKSTGAAQEASLTRIFGWTASQTHQAVYELVEKSLVSSGVRLENQPGEWIAIQEIL
jgi:hypothetical protein